MKTRRAKISVIVPVFNGADSVERCLQSVVSQSEKALEIICIDDGSTDATPEILSRISAADERVKVVVQKNAGVSAARNKGMEIAQGDYIQFVDGDDELAPDICRNLLAEAESENSDVVQCGHCEVTDGVVSRESFPNEKCNADNLLACPEILHCQTKYVWDKLFRRSMLTENQIRFAPYDYHEDHLFLFHVDLVARNFRTIPYIGYRYSKTSAGAATRAYDKRLLDCTKAYWDICRKAREAGVFDVLSPSIWRNCSQSYAWRIWGFRRYDDRELQEKIVQDWAEFFTSNFPQWQKNLHLAGIPVVLPKTHDLKVLLLGGTGALGAHLRDILAEKGCDVWVTSRGDHADSERIHYLKGNAMERPFFDKLMKSRWDVIVDFMVYGPIGFQQRLPILLEKCGQYLFLSSSRVYADAGDREIDETSPRIVDIVKDEAYLKTNEYALAKGRAEDILLSCGKRNWTVVRPYITFSDRRLQLGTLEKELWLARALKGKPIVFSEDIAEKTTTLTFGFDVARGMAALIGKDEALGEMFHITSNLRVRWRDVLDLYVRVIKEVTGRECKVVLTKHSCQLKTNGRYQVLFDRLYNRRFNNSKIGRFIDVDSFSEPMAALERCLKEFLKAPEFLAVNEELDALHDEVCRRRIPPRLKYTDERNVQILISALKAHGIRQVIASPGTTNLTFVASIQQDDWFVVKSAPDERSAAYMACGWAAESGRPVVISCTGATASRNYLPGLTEAYYRKLPVLAVTGTLYERRSGHLTAQFVDRSSPAVDAVNLSVSMPLVRANDDEWHNTIAANRAILELFRHGGGPVHINLETAHSRNYTVESLPPIRVIKRFFKGEALPPVPKGKVAVFVGAHVPWSDELTAAVEAFAEKYDAPVFCDHASNYRGAHEMNFALACYQQSGSFAAYRADTVVHIGEVSGDYPSFKIIGAAKVWRVNPDGEIRDAFRRLVHVFEMSELDFFKRYAAAGSSRKTGYARKCRAHIEDLQSRIPQLPFSNLWVASRGCREIPKNSVIHFGILNSFRSWSLFPLDRSIIASCNTGGFGIDGCLSTALGASFAAPDKIHYIVLGDLAFFYDMNSLGNRHVGRNLRVLLINNGKGVEFRNFNHPASQFGDAADEFVAAGGHYGGKSRELVRHYAEALGFRYLSSSGKDDYAAAAKIFWDAQPADRPLLFEVFTDSADDSDALEAMTLIEGGAPFEHVAPPPSRPAEKKNVSIARAGAAPAWTSSRKIAILTFHTAFNCGAHLQAWALQTVLRRLGFEPEFPDCTKIGYFKRIRSDLYNPASVGFKARWKTRVKQFAADVMSVGVEDKKRHRFRMFAKHYLRIVPRTVEEVDRMYPAVIVGSDQVWNSGITRRESSYYLTTALKNPRLKRYSYAISVGDKAPPPERVPVLAAAAAKFENLSFRENVLPSLKDRHGRGPTLDPDPTLLLSREDFSRIAYPKRIVKARYLLVYSLKYDAALWAAAREMGKRMGLKPVIILVYQYGRYGLADGKGVDIAVSPDRFLAYFRDAEVVLTSTFHGTVFSLIYGKKFAVFPNYAGAIPMRCERMLKSLHEESHLVRSADDFGAVERALANSPREETFVALSKLRSMAIRKLKSTLPDVSALPSTEAGRREADGPFLLRKLKGGVKCLSENGVRYTLKHAVGKALRFAGIRSRL